MTRFVVLAALVGLLLAAPALVFYGYLVHEERLPPHETFEELHYTLRQQPALRRFVQSLRGDPDYGAWNRAGSDGLVLDPAAEEIAQLEAIGYVTGSELAEPSGATTGVTVHLRGARPGYNLYNSGHGPVALLVDMEGREVARWSRPFEEIFPDVEPAQNMSPLYYRRVHLLDDGDLLVIFEGIGIARLDRESRVVWAAANGAHHDVDVQPDGSLVVLTRTAHLNPSWHEKRPILEDYVSRLSPSGEELERLSILEAFQRSRFEPLLDIAPESGDIFHTNSVEILSGELADRSAAFAKGRALLSLNHLNAVAVMDLADREIVWVLTGLSRHQHDARETPNDGVLFLDNVGHHGFSKVIEVDPASQEILWGYYGDAANGFVTDTSGSNQRLDNGNTLITESNAGRAFEVDPSGAIVWEFRSPHRAGDDGQLVATLFDLQRITPERVAGWLPQAAD